MWRLKLNHALKMLFTPGYREAFEALVSGRRDIIKGQAKMVYLLCFDKARKHCAEVKEQWNKDNLICPKCGAHSIVDKYVPSPVRGRYGFFSGYPPNFPYGLPPYGSCESAIDFCRSLPTAESMLINHCNGCNHEWQKTTLAYKDPNDVLNDGIQGIYHIMRHLWSEKTGLDHYIRGTRMDDEERVTNSRILDQVKDGSHYWAQCSKEIFSGCNIDTVIHLCKTESRKFAPHRWERLVEIMDCSKLSLSGVEDYLYRDCFARIGLTRGDKRVEAFIDEHTSGLTGEIEVDR